MKSFARDIRFPRVLPFKTKSTSKGIRTVSQHLGQQNYLD
jgi:hypothetical protein